MPPQHQFNRTKVLKELQEHNSFFDDFVDMFPAKLYVSSNTGDEEFNPKFFKGQHKESKEARRARNKQSKLVKFDPERAETTLQAKKRKEEEDDNMTDISDDENDVTMMNDDSADEEEANNSFKNKNKESGSWVDENDGNGDLGETDDAEKKNNNTHINQSSIEALRAKLHAKIAEKRALRPENEDNSAVISKRAARRAEKKRRFEAKMRSNEKYAKVNESSKRTKKVEMGGTKINTVTINNNSESKTEDLSGIDFGGIAGLKKVPTFKDNKSLANTNGKNRKSLDTLLALAQKKKERLEELKAGTDENKEKAKRIIWGDTLKAATGEKNNNDPALLKKAIKRRAKKKVKSQEGWKVRMNQVKDNMDERQKIRSHNLDKRQLGGAAGANLSHKRIEEEDEKDSSTKKKGRLGPHSSKGREGFEGKKQEFINGKGKKKEQ